jgi:hypothetical protein
MNTEPGAVATGYVAQLKTLSVQGHFECSNGQIDPVATAPGSVFVLRTDKNSLMRPNENVGSEEGDTNALPSLVEGEDYYFEGSMMVFTERFLLRRGFCCESGCRHCPYGFSKDKHRS